MANFDSTVFTSLRNLNKQGASKVKEIRKIYEIKEEEEEKTQGSMFLSKMND